MDEQRNCGGSGHKFMEQMHALCFHLDVKLGYARKVASGATRILILSLSEPTTCA